MTASISTLPVRPVRKAIPTQHTQRVQSRALKRRLSRQAIALKIVTGVTVALLTVSLTDSARGVEITTSFPAWKGYRRWRWRAVAAACIAWPLCAVLAPVS